jgi:hypothetical protein
MSVRVALETARPSSNWIGPGHKLAFDVLEAVKTDGKSSVNHPFPNGEGLGW